MPFVKKLTDQELEQVKPGKDGYVLKVRSNNPSIAKGEQFLIGFGATVADVIEGLLGESKIFPLHVSQMSLLVDDQTMRHIWEPTNAQTQLAAELTTVFQTSPTS